MISKFNKVRRRRFLQLLAKTGNVTRAAAAVGVSPVTAYNARRKNAAFRTAWQTAIEEAADAMEAVARERALEGWEKPVFYQGRCVGTVREYSDSLLMWLLRAHRPERYRERAEAVGPEEPLVVRIVRFAPEGGVETENTVRRDRPTDPA